MGASGQEDWGEDCEEGASLVTQRIAVGIRAESSYPRQVLDQLGISSVPVESFEEGVAQGVRVFLWSGAHGQGEVVSMPGEQIAVITDATARNGRAQGRGEVATRSYYFQLAGKSPFATHSFYANLPVWPATGESFGACYDRANNEIANSGIGIIEREGLLLVSLPWDICAYEQGVDWRHRPYFSPTARKHFVEVGPMLDTGAFRRLLLEILLFCFDRVGLPLVRVSPLYRNKRHFSFRVDADGFTESSTEAGLRVAQKSGLRFTWFLDMGCWKKKGKWIARLLKHNQDLQFHCFRHMTYASQEVNEINIRKGLAVMRRNGITPNAIVSPLGYYCRGFSEAIKKHRFAFSSEFGYAVDDLPSYPWNDKSYPLQIPVHPACSGVLSRAGFSPTEQFDHLFDVIERRGSADGICILYDHPIGGLEAHETQYVDFFSQLRSRPYEYICLSDYYRAWRERPQCPAILFDRGTIEVDGFQDNGFRIEQVTNGSGTSVRWGDASLPLAILADGTEEFCYPPACVQDLACKNDLLFVKQRNCTRFAWHVNEAYETLGRKAGYFRCRRLLGRFNWMRAARDRIALRIRRRTGGR